MDDPRRKKGWLRHIGLAAGLAGVLAGHAVTWEPEAAPPPAAPPALDLTSAEPMRQTETEALAHAVSIGARVEIGALRTESREVYANADGTTTSVDHAEPVRVAKGGTWVPVDATLTVGEDGSIGPKAATIGMRISRGGAEPLISVERAGRQLTLDWPGTLPAPVLSGEKATYAEVLPGVDLVLDVQVTGFSHVLVIKTPEAAANPALAALEFGLDTENLTVAENAEGGLAAVDPATGDAVLEAAAPIMWDSGQAAPVAARAAAAAPVPTEPSETAAIAAVDVAVDADGITLTPDRDMLTSPETRWPVYVDPVWQSTSNSGWAMVASGYPSEKYWKFKDDEGVGECPVSSGWCNGVGIKRIYYALPTPYAGKTILSAEFRVTMTHTYDSSAQPVQLFRGGSTISSGTTWSNKPSVADVLETKSPKGTQGSCTSTNQNVGFNATDAVKYAVTNNKSTTTFGLKAQDEGEYHAWKRFCGNAILSVNYNRAPVQPKQSELTMNPGGACVSGTARKYVNKPPTLYMIFRDPDHAPSAGRTESVYGEIQVYWTPAGGTQVTKTFTTVKKASGTTIQYTLSGIPQNTVITWQVRASDGTGWGPWSWEGDTQTACQFVYDATIPAAPDIDSPEYLPADATETTSDCAEEAADRGSMGTYGTFTFDAPTADTVRYEYGFNSDPNPANVLTPTAAGGPVSIQWLPDTDGPRRITVKGYDKANNPSAVAECHFSVATVNASGEWSMDDAAGGPAADSRGEHPALPGPGASFGVPGPGCQGVQECVRDRAVHLDGTESGYLATASGGMIDTSQGFSVAAWVRLTDATRDAVAVSLDGSGEPGFTLGYRAADKKWAFAVPVTDVDSLGEWKVTAADVPEIGKWTYLAAVFDPVKHTLTIYVNGKASAPAARRSEWKARGPVQIGRAYEKTGYTGFWTGDVANVAVIPRLIQAKEATEMAKLLPVRLAYWPLNEAAGAEAPEYDGGQDLTLAGGATVAVLDDPFGEPALVGTGHLVLDGIDDYAATTGPIAATDGSFTVSLRVRLAATPDAPMTVLSQSGSKTAGFAIRCADGRWEVALPAADAAGGQVTHVIDDQVAVEPTFSGTHLTYVYNAFSNEAKLYVNGQLALSAVADYPKPWKASGPLQVGRQLVGGAYREHFAGVVDDVRVYAGVAGDAAITRMALLSEQPEL